MANGCTKDVASHDALRRCLEQSDQWDPFHGDAGEETVITLPPTDGWIREFTFGKGRPLEDDIEFYVRVAGGNASFAELQDALGEQTRGTYEIHDEKDENLILWLGASREFADAFSKLLSERRIELTATHPSVYMKYGPIPTLPIAKRAPLSGYKTRRWLPVVINPRQPAGDKVRVSRCAASPSSLTQNNFKENSRTLTHTQTTTIPIIRDRWDEFKISRTVAGGALTAKTNSVGYLTPTCPHCGEEFWEGTGLKLLGSSEQLDSEAMEGLQALVFRIECCVCGLSDHFRLSVDQRGGLTRDERERNWWRR
jgi:hypothetical protein